MQNLCKLLWVLLFLCCGSQGIASNNSLVTLEEPLSARSTGMGGAFVAVADDASAVFLNPAGLGFAATPVMSTLFKKDLLDINYTALSGVYPLGRGALGAALTYFDGGALNVKELDGTDTLYRAETDLTLDLCYGLDLGRYLALGAGAKLVQSSLANLAASTTALDLGLLLALPMPENDGQTLNLGFSMSNWGPGIIYAGDLNPLPLLFRFGAAYRLRFQDESQLLMSVEGDLERGYDTAYAVGAEYSRQVFRFRIGYGGESVHLGLGFRLDVHELDYSFSPILGDATHVVSYTYHLGGARR